MAAAGLIYRLGVALAIGLLVGTERHWRERGQPAGSRTAGIRSFTLAGLMGGVVAALAGSPGMAPDTSPGMAPDWSAALLIGLAFLGFSAALITFRLRESIAEDSFSVTGVFAGQATFLLGAMAVRGDPITVAAAAVAITAVLAAREGLHGFVSGITWVELRSAILLLSMTLIALPLVPDRSIEALAGLNLARVWKLAVLLAGVSYVGYIAVRVLGSAAGLLAAGAATGLLSSTAATLAYARAARAGTAPARALAAAALAAGCVAMLRTAALAWAVAPAMAWPLLPALGIAGAVQGAAALLLLLGRRDIGAAADNAVAAAPGNPFELLAVLQIAGLLALIELLAKAAAASLGAAAVLTVAALSGLADTDAVTLSMGSLVPETFTSEQGALAVAVAVACNTVAKAVYAISLGTPRYAALYAGPAAVSLMLAAAMLLAGW